LWRISKYKGKMNYNDYELKEYVGETVSERQWDVSAAFPVLMRKVYVWMTLALVITGYHRLWCSQ
jgi:hypothetical protein